MIPPLNGKPMAEPPPWYDEVIDLTLDEARGLIEMGVKVYRDFSGEGGSPWHSRPFQVPVPNIHWITAIGNFTTMYHIPKESNDAAP